MPELTMVEMDLVVGGSAGFINANGMPRHTPTLRKETPAEWKRDKETLKIVGIGAVAAVGGALTGGAADAAVLGGAAIIGEVIHRL